MSEKINTPKRQFFVIHIIPIAFIMGIIAFVYAQLLYYFIGSSFLWLFLLINNIHVFKKKEEVFYLLLKQLFFSIVFIVSFYYSRGTFNTFSRVRNIIFNSKNINGIIIQKNELSKNFYEYLIQVYFPVTGYVKIRSKIDKNESEYVRVKWIYWLYENQEKTISDYIDKNIVQSMILANGISGKIVSYSQQHITIIHDLLFFLYTVKLNIMNSWHFCGSETENFFRAILWGSSPSKIGTKEIDEFYTYFKEWGIAHYFARSGLHVIMIISFFMILCSFFSLPFKISWYLSIVFLLLFALISASSLPFYRAIVLWLLLGIFRLWGLGSRNYLALLSITIILFLFYNPFWIFSISFQLSFFATAVLALIAYF